MMMFIHPKKTEYAISGTAKNLNQFDFDNPCDIHLGDRVQVLRCIPRPV